MVGRHASNVENRWCREEQKVLEASGVRRRKAFAILTH